MASGESGTRKERLAAALKENLKRRKAQARAKAERPTEAERMEQADLNDRQQTALKNVPNRT